MRSPIKLAILSLCTGCLFASCQTQTQPQTEQAGQDFVPPATVDDYSEFTDIHHYREWGTYNVHDPAAIKAGDYYYLYSTDAIYWPEGAEQESDTISIGNVQVRRSRDLVNWEFFGWALDSIPQEALDHIREATDGEREPNGIWAPYVQEYNGEYRLYYSVSVFGANTSCIGLAVSNSPEGPWEPRGLVVKTFEDSPMNAIDPSVEVDAETGQHWMMYGSYFGGLFGLELDPETGLAMHEGEQGHVVARRAEGKDRIIEAPEIIYNPDTEKYYLFVSYDALFTHYNIRVGRADNPEGPYYDMYGNNMADTSNNFPVLTYAYRFEDHPGWAGVGHCGLLNDNGRFFMFHQGRLAPENLMMVLHTREVFWTEDGWPVVSPQRYAGVPDAAVEGAEVAGSWEFIQLDKVQDTVTLWQGQIPPGGWHYSKEMFNNPVEVELLADGGVSGLEAYSSWSMEDDKIQLNGENAEQVSLILTRGWDWENDRQTVLFTGIGEDGFSIWGKKVE